MSTTEHTWTETNGHDNDNEVDSSVRLRQEAERVWSYTPFNETSKVDLTLARVRNFLVTPTKKGKWPSDKELTNFLQICKTRRLNPWVRDAFLLGYDTKQGAKFETIVAYQALSKRAEVNEQYDGLECGMILTTQEGKTMEVEGSFCLKDEELVGAWARVYRKDRSKPTTAKISRVPYDKGFGRWEVDPHGMLVKCAKSAAMREAFPSDLGGLYTEDEISEDSLEGSDSSRTMDDQPHEETEAATDTAGDDFADQLVEEIDHAPDQTEVNAIRDLTLDQCDSDDQRAFVNNLCDIRVKQIKATRGERSNENQEQEQEAT